MPPAAPPSGGGRSNDGGNKNPPPPPPGDHSGSGKEGQGHQQPSQPSGSGSNPSSSGPAGRPPSPTAFATMGSNIGQNNVYLAQAGKGQFTDPADKAYEAIRESKTDIAAIAKNTGIKPENVEKVKNHLFFDRHFLDRYVHLGIPAEERVFDSDIEIANAWARLEAGNFTKEDMQLLRHETAERWYMKKHGPGYTAAHNAAEARYPAENLWSIPEKTNSLER